MASRTSSRPAGAARARQHDAGPASAYRAPAPRAAAGRLPCLLAAAGVVLGGCAAGERGAGAPSDSVRDSAGIRIVETSGDLRARDSGWRVEGAPLLEIGAREGEPAYLFAALGALVRLSDGRIAVRETRTGEVRYFGPDGRHLRSALGRGEGPAELRFVQGSLVVLVGDSLLVGDRLDRLVLDGEGRFVRRLTTRPEALQALVGHGSGSGGAWTADGSYMALIWEPIPVPLTPGGPQRQEIRVVRVSADLAHADTLLQMRGSHYQVLPDGDLASPPFYASPRGALSATGTSYLVAEGSPPELHRLWDDGRHEVLRWTEAPEPVTPADVEHWVESFVDRAPAQEARLRAMFAAVEPPSHKPVVGWVVAGRGGEALLASGHPRDPAFQPVRWSVIDARGVHLGGIELPERFEPRDFGPDWILGEWRDELDVPFVRLYRLTRGRP